MFLRIYSFTRVPRHPRDQQTESKVIFAFLRLTLFRARVWESLFGSGDTFGHVINATAEQGCCLQSSSSAWTGLVAISKSMVFLHKFTAELLGLLFCFTFPCRHSGYKNIYDDDDPLTPIHQPLSFACLFACLPSDI